MKKRDTVTYVLKEGNKVVYIGTTKNPERRKEQHRQEGKKFSQLKKTSLKMTEDGAKKKEQQDLQSYRKTHQEKKPKYNKESDG